MNINHCGKFEVRDIVYCIFLSPRKIWVTYELKLIIMDVRWYLHGNDKMFSYLVEELDVQERESPWTVKEENLFTTLAAARAECKKIRGEK